MSVQRPYRRIVITTRRLILVGSVVAVVLWPLISIAAEAEVRKVRVEIRNSAEDTPMKGLRVKPRGHSELSGLSTEAGLTELLLPPGLMPGDSIEIELEPGTTIAREWMFLQPYNGNLTVPRLTQGFSFYKILLVKRAHIDAILNKPRVAKSDNTERNVSIDRVDGYKPFLKK